MRYALYNGNIISTETYHTVDLYRLGIADELRCPVCNELVTFVNSVKVDSYFKHRVGNNNIDCDNYYPSQGYFDPNRNFALRKELPELTEFEWSGNRFEISLHAKNAETNSIYFQLVIEGDEFEGEHQLTVHPMHGPRQDITLGKEKVHLSFVVDPSEAFLKCNGGINSVSQKVLAVNSILKRHKYLVFNRSDGALILSNDLEREEVALIFNSITRELFYDVRSEDWEDKLISDGYSLRHQESRITIWTQNIAQVECSTNTIYVESIGVIKVFNDSSTRFELTLRGAQDTEEVLSKSLIAEPGLTSVDLTSDELTSVMVIFYDSTYRIEMIRDVSRENVSLTTFEVTSGDSYNLVQRDDSLIQITSENGLWYCSSNLHKKTHSKVPRAFLKDRSSWNRNRLGLEWLNYKD